jgi:exopolysaccharide biosynthesis polyprenyl glycosylphosphotransferase
MSARSQPEPVVAPPAPPEEVERFFTESWPQTRLVSAGFVLALAVALGFPIALRAASVPLALAMSVPVVVGIIAARHLFSSRVLRTKGRVTVGVVAATIPPAGLAGAVVAAAGIVAGIDVTPAAAAGSIAGTALVLWGAAAARAVEVRYRLNARRVFLVATEAQRRDVEREIRRDGAMQMVGFSAVEPGRLRPVADALQRTIEAARPTMLVLSNESARSEAVVAAAAEFHARGGRVRDLNGFYGDHFRKVPLSELTPSWFLFDVAEIHRPRLYLAFKRAFEVAVAGTGLLLAAPVLVVAALAIKLEEPAEPVLFRQRRVGKANRVFRMLKLRTMRRPGPDAAAAWAGDEQARITRVGRVLRRWRVDELPQLANVLLGDLSLVGPRPEQAALVERLEADIDFYSARHRVRPGLTGWAQVNHGYGGSSEGTLQKLQFDFYYVRHQSLRLDLLIIVMTLRAILRGSTS